MIAEDDIKALTYDVSPIGSEEEEQQGGEGKAIGDLAEQGRKEEGTEIEEEKSEETEQEKREQKEIEKETEGGEKEVEKVEQGQRSPKTLEKEVAATLTTISTPIKPKKKRKRQDSLFSGLGRAQESEQTNLSPRQNC